MSNDNVLDQSEIERLLGGMGGGAPSPPTPPPVAADSSGVLDQSELDAIFGGAAKSAGASTPTAPAAPPPSGGVLNQSQIESLLGGVNMPTPPSPSKSGPTVIGGPAPLPGSHANGSDEDEDGVPQGDIDYLLKRADNSVRSVVAAKLDLPTEVIEFQFPEHGGTVPSSEHATLDQISEVELDVKIELGRTYMYVEDVLKLRKGSVVPLDKMAGDAVDIYVNGRLIARGEVLVMNENFCVRIAELLAGAIPLE